MRSAAPAAGRSRIEGLSEGGDVRATAEALRAMGVGIARRQGGWDVDGVGAGALLQPARALDMGNSGTSARLLMGLLATHPITATFIGDESLCRRPMDRVIAPLSRLGADVASLLRPGRVPGGRVAEITNEDAAEPVEVARDRGPVEPHQLAHLGELLGLRRASEDGARRVAGE